MDKKSWTTAGDVLQVPSIQWENCVNPDSDSVIPDCANPDSSINSDTVNPDCVNPDCDRSRHFKHP